MTDSVASADLRQIPTEEFIDEIRRRYPVEQEVDKVLTQKMRNRIIQQQPYQPVSLEQLVEGITKLLSHHLSKSFHLDNTRWLSGGASMLQMAFDLSWYGEEESEPELIKTPMVLRVSPMEPVCATSFLREAEVVNLLHQHTNIRVPKCYWTDEDGDYLIYPGIVYGFVTGVAKPSKSPSKQVTGIGLNFGAELREQLAPRVIADIARIHTVDLSNHTLKGFDPIKTGSNEHIHKEINWWQRVWEEDRGEDEPIIHVAASWLRRHAPVLDHVSIVHNDLRSGNFLFDEATAEVTAWLDWELVSLGDRHQDLGWLMAHQYGHFAEDGETYLVSGLVSKEEFVRQYEEKTGLPVDPVRLRYFDIFNSWRAAIIVMGPGYRVPKGSKTHQDVVVSWLSAIGYHILENLRKALLEEQP